MTSSANDLARGAAQRLVELDRNLPAFVEAQIHSGQPPQRFDPATATAIALATLVLNVAKFAWDIYRERQKDAAARETLTRELRLKVTAEGSISAEQRDRVIAVVVEELTKQPS
jgi:hypothetical protein